MVALLVFLVSIILLLFLRASIKFYHSQKFYRIKEEATSFSLERSEDKKATAYIFLAAWLLKKNARYSDDKVKFIHAYIKRNFGKSSVDATYELTQALRKTATIRAIARWVVQHLSTEQERVKLMQFLLDVSFAEKRIIDREIVAITRFGTLIGVSYSYINQQITNRSKYFQSNEKSAVPLHEHLTIKSALKTLQLDENATQKEIKRAYRKLAAKVHPDKFEQESTEIQLEMKAHFLEIQLAYNYLIN